MTPLRILIIRFSSFGDIFQALEAASHLHRAEGLRGSLEVTWLTRSDFAELVSNQPSVQNVVAFDRKASFFDLVRLAWNLASKVDFVYDAHSNLRSAVVRAVIRLRWLGTSRKTVVRPKNRLKRFLFFRFRLPMFPVPFRGAESYLWPLRNHFRFPIRFEERTWEPGDVNQPGAIPKEFSKWSVQFGAETKIIAFAPSAAWPNKRWPIERWISLAEALLMGDPSRRILLLGGPDDHFLEDLVEKLPLGSTLNLAGKTSLLQSARLVALANCVIANDTGLLHVADRLQVPSVAIIGPTAFGYTSSPVARIAEVPRADLPCKPCSKDGRDPCRNSENLKCLRDVSVDMVLRLANECLEVNR